MKIVATKDLAGLVGTDLGVSDWITIDQERVNQFADTTEDHQFIHVNEEAAKKTPFGGTIAHRRLSRSKAFLWASIMDLKKSALSILFALALVFGDNLR